jgi:rSAM/selenodomain-associated transferase 1
MTATRIVVFAKAPVAGLAKTRLIPALGAEQAAGLARRMLLSTLQQAQAADVGPVELCVTPRPSDPAWESLPPVQGVAWSAQIEGDLGARMAHAAERALACGERVLLIGTDCPELDAARVQHAATLLEHSHAVLYPTFDGGYALLGLGRFDPRPFERMPWSTPELAARTIECFQTLGWRLSVGVAVHDIDEPADLRWLPAEWRIDLRRASSPSAPGSHVDESRHEQGREREQQPVRAADATSGDLEDDEGDHPE